MSKTKSNPLIEANPKELPGIIETLDNLRNHPQATDLDQMLINIIQYLTQMELDRFEVKCPECSGPATHPSGLCRDCHQGKLEAEEI